MISTSYRMQILKISFKAIPVMLSGHIIDKLFNCLNNITMTGPTKKCGVSIFVSSNWLMK